jgi:hypothetical protein
MPWRVRAATVLEDPHSLLGTDETVVHARDAHRYIRGTARHQAGY